MLTRTCLCIALLVALVGATGAHAEGPDPIWLGLDGKPLPFVSHEEALEFLSSATVIETKEITGSQNRPLKVLLEKDGVRAHAVFRGVHRTWQREWVRGKWYVQLLDRAASERAAYVVARMLGFDNIPPTVLRDLEDQRGTIQLWLEGAEPFSDLVARRADAPRRWSEQMSAIWVFDNLVFNVDRHPGNILVDSNDTVWMIDHTQAFQYDDRLVDADGVRSIPLVMWERLQTISDGQFERVLAGVVNEDQIEAFLKRRERLVERIEELIAEHGEDRVVRPYRGNADGPS